jgi:hypothetical protein
MRKSLFVCFVISLAVSLAHSQEKVDFESGRWQLGPGSRIEDFLGRKALSGSAMVKDVEFENGIIEVDIACKQGRIFPGIVFRQQNTANFEEFYIRPHKSG